MKQTLKVFLIPKDRVPAGPPEAARELEIEAADLDGLREAALAEMSQEGYRVRALSFSPTGLIAYVEEVR